MQLVTLFVFLMAAGAAVANLNSSNIKKKTVAIDPFNDSACDNTTPGGCRVEIRCNTGYLAMSGRCCYTSSNSNNSCYTAQFVREGFLGSDNANGYYCDYEDAAPPAGASQAAATADVTTTITAVVACLKRQLS